MTSKEIRQSFFDFFKSKGHKLVPSSPVIPHGDPTLFFTNAGMNQFKQIFLNQAKATDLRIVDTQKCIRVSGKHNDLDEVGRDTYHHTFFEMLGNWSFGDYYKKEAIIWGWELLTEVWKMPKERIWASVYKTDDEAFNFWKTETDINPEHILRFGEKDNFWEMGETGPCGPCSEIHIDLSENGNLDASNVNAGNPLLIEIWNLVFIQNNRKIGGELEFLPEKHVDTGMGFERVCSVFDAMKNNFKKFPSNYDSDVFLPLIKKISEVTNHKYGVDEKIDVAHRVIADHLRALSFAIADGATPSNEGRGYVLRRILRRAARFGRTLNQTEPFIYKIVETLSNEMSHVFPEIKIQKTHIENILKSEEESFNRTLDNGLEIFEEEVKNIGSEKMFSGKSAFKLYDTFGFPLDLTELLCSERGLKVNTEEFEENMNLQKERARKASGGKFQFSSESINIPNEIQNNLTTEFCGYEDKFEIKTNVNFVSNNFLSLDRTPLYAESGGQISDTGELIFENFSTRVIDSKKLQKGILHLIDKNEIEIKIGSEVIARVDSERRRAIMRNHTAAHLLHAALRKILGTHVHQAGSLVANDHFRFDFAHQKKVSENEILEIENFINEKIIEATPLVHYLNLPIEDARKLGALMFFGDKYGEKVNVVQYGDYSIEFCGGTHAKNTLEIGFFKIKKEESISSGVRRIEGVTHNNAIKLLELRNKNYKEQIEAVYKLLDEILILKEKLEFESSGRSELIKVNISNLDVELRKLEEIPSLPLLVETNNLKSEFEKQIDRFLKLENFYLNLIEKKKIFTKELSKFLSVKVLMELDKIVENSETKNQIKIVSAKINACDMESLKYFGEALRQKLISGVGLLASEIDEKVALVCVVTDDLVKSKNLNSAKIILDVAKIVGGGGGGKPTISTAGGKDISKISEALNFFKNLFN